MSKTKGSFAKKTSRKQKIYKMKGCSKTCKNYLGGSPDAPLAYTGKPIFSVPNPNLAYTGKGGASCGLSNPANIPINTNAASPAYPNTGPITNGANTIFNNPISQNGGCGCGLPGMSGGKRKKKDRLNHRDGCYCSECKKKRMIGGMKGGNTGIPYPDGLVGAGWTPNISNWPGVDGIPGNRNFLPQNLYNGVDPQTSMKAIGANPPFLYKGGRKQKGGTTSNLMSQDLINLGRQFQFGIGSAYNALAGYQSPINPLPWKDQFPNKTALTHSII